eukprot:528721-Rhodomonas_salina.2
MSLVQLTKSLEHSSTCPFLPPPSSSLSEALGRAGSPKMNNSPQQALEGEKKICCNISATVTLAIE